MTDDSETITITVNEVNVAPVLGPIGDQTVDEAGRLTFTATATDADLPANTLTFSPGCRRTGSRHDHRRGHAVPSPGPRPKPRARQLHGHRHRHRRHADLTDSETITITVERGQRGPGAGSDRQPERG